MSESQVTTNHDTIRRWTEARQGRPAAVRDRQRADDPGILRIQFDETDDALEPIGWDEFFHKFDDAELAFLYQDRTEDGDTSRFFKLVQRPTN